MLSRLYPIYLWLFLIPMFGLLTTVAGSLILIFTWFAPRLVNRVIPLVWARVTFWLTPAGIEVRGLANIQPAQSYVIAVNHVSLYDIFVLYGWLPMDLKWVMKKEIRKVPVIGIACAALGHIYLDRHNRAAAVATLQAAKRNLRSGSSILFFPEGTRSPTGELMAFKKGAFVTARDLELPILPVTLCGTERIMPNKSVRVRPGRVVMHIHPPVPVADVRELNTEQLIARVHATIAGPLQSGEGQCLPV